MGMLLDMIKERGKGRERRWHGGWHGARYGGALVISLL
jgi:hypothetical protein